MDRSFEQSVSLNSEDINSNNSDSFEIDLDNIENIDLDLLMQDVKEERERMEKILDLENEKLSLTGRNLS
jgi:reverse gyrase